MARKKIFNCWQCGTNLSIKNCRETTKSASNFACCCLDCESKFFNKIAGKEGKSIALFFSCMKNDVPFKPIVIDESDFFESENSWEYYLDLLAEKDEEFSKRELFFEDGITDMFAIFGKNMVTKELDTYIEKYKEKAIQERQKQHSLKGTARQRELFGIFERDNDKFTAQDYTLMEKNYDAYSAGGLSPQQQLAAQKVAFFELQETKCMQRNDTNGAKNIRNNIKTLLEGELLRTKDEKPVDDMRYDTMTKATEDAGLMENGRLKTHDELVDVLWKNIIQKPKYPQTVDVADQIVLKIENTILKNEDLAIKYGITKEEKIEDFWDEMAKEPTKEEKKRKAYCQVGNVAIIEGDK